MLVKEGFTVLPYTSMTLPLRSLGCSILELRPSCLWVRRLGVGWEFRMPQTRILREMITGVPLILDADVGTASDTQIGNGAMVTGGPC